MRLIHLEGKYVVFFCDDCGKRLDENEPGEAFWYDFDKFVEDVEAGRESEVPKFLCWDCFRKRGGPVKDWYNPNWRGLL